MRVVRPMVLALAALGWTTPCGAQERATLALATLVCEPPLTAGMTLRVHAGRRRLEGRLREVRGDTLRLAGGPLHAVTLRARLDSTTRLEVRGRPRSRVRGAAIGAGMGLAGGLLLGATIVHAFRGDLSDVGTVSGVFLPYSVAVGAVTGAVLPGHHWRAVHLTPRP